ncbi:hypothetical protein RGQ29_018660 [Quercus rubra]|uniref:BED-type domain-containing protein n=1 Tax=Quercus rubra TaxID=3512 RepID=A0AAN7FJJ5_QUERU|nr:hypothetical protein RGQ29_018660 [Quercus rubra]
MCGIHSGHLGKSSNIIPGPPRKKIKRKNAPGNRSDLGWEHGVEVGSRQVQCNYCKEIHSGGIYRLKHHLAGTRKNVSACPSVPENVREKFVALLYAQAEASIKKKRWYTIEEEDDGSDDELVEVQQLHSSKGRGRHIGSMDKFVAKKKQVTMNRVFKKGERDLVIQQIARFFYTSAIPFNCVKNPEFLRMIDMISRFGIGLRPPSYHEIRETCLKKEVDFTQQMLEEYKVEWKKTDTSDISKTAEKVCQMLDEVVDRVGEENVVQLVTDNAANYKLAGEMLTQKRKCLFWTPCAAHCLDLMLEDFEKKIKDHKYTIGKGKKITTYIYSRAMLLNWLRDFTKGRELIRLAAARFATSYLTLSCLNEFKGELMTMFSSKQWRCSKFAKTKEGKIIHDIVMDNNGFWRLVVKCLKAAIPLLKVLRLVDSDTPPIGFIYQEMEKAKEEIQKNFNNPGADIKLGLYTCLQRMVPEVSDRKKIDVQLEKFKQAKGLFGIEAAILARNTKQPTEWWDSYGDDCPELKKFAIRILSLTCSSSGCERNWSAFEMVRPNDFSTFQRRNRLHQKKMNDLVFVMYNLKMKERRAKPLSTKEEIGLENLSSDDEWLAANSVDLEDDSVDFDEDNEGDDEVSRVAAKGNSVLVHDVSDEYHENDDGSNDDDSDRPPPGFERVRDFDDYIMDVDTRKGDSD